MKLFLGLLPSSLPDHTRIFGEIGGKLVDLKLAYAAYLCEVETNVSADPLAAAVLGCDMVAFLKRGEKSLEAARKAVAHAAKSATGSVVERQQVRLMAPVPRPGALISAGKNFSDHVSEMSSKKGPTDPVAFLKLPGSVIGPQDDIPHPPEVKNLDYEVEIAVVIGKPCIDVGVDEALDYVAGYSAFNDISARDVIRAENKTGIHYLDGSLPVLTRVLALELTDRRGHEAVLKHPNTGWKLIVHEGGAQAKDKPERNHYGVRVANNDEVDRAHQYLLANKVRLGLAKVVKRKERAGSYSMFFVEPGGNYWEIESYENRHKAGLPEHIAHPWKQKLTEEKLPGCGYIPQAMTHGTMECTNLAASVKFYKQGLGLDVITHVPTIAPHDVKHPATPWYVVSLEVPPKNKHFLTPRQRYTVAVESPAALNTAHREFNERRKEFGLTTIEEIESTADGESFLLSDLDRNWWEIAALNRHSRAGMS